MIREAYCSFKVSKLLKEKGFNVPCCRRYNGDSMITQSALYSTPFYQEEKASGYVLCPTHQLAMAWLREKHDLFIGIIPQEVGIGVTGITYVIFRITEDLWTPVYNMIGFDSYEETSESAILYCLENLT